MNNDMAASSTAHTITKGSNIKIVAGMCNGTCHRPDTCLARRTEYIRQGLATAAAKGPWPKAIYVLTEFLVSKHDILAPVKADAAVIMIQVVRSDVLKLSRKFTESEDAAIREAIPAMLGLLVMCSQSEYVGVIKDTVMEFQRLMVALGYTTSGGAADRVSLSKWEKSRRFLTCASGSLCWNPVCTADIKKGHEMVVCAGCRIATYCNQPKCQQMGWLFGHHEACKSYP